MKKLRMYLIPILLLFSALTEAQTGTSTTTTATATGATEMSDSLMWMLGFGGLVLAAEMLLIRFSKARWTPYSTIRLLGLTLIIMATLAIAVIGNNKDHITAIIGLLGTLAGYLLGKDAREKDLISTKEINDTITEVEEVEKVE